MAVGGGWSLWKRWVNVSINNKFLVVTGIIVAILTGVNTVVFYLESESTSKQISTLSGEAGEIVGAMNMALKDSQTAINRAFIENERAIKAATTQSKTALDASINASRMDQRAWLGTAVGKTKGIQQQGTILSFGEIELLVRNGGKTPALNIDVDCCHTVILPFEDKPPTYEAMVANETRELIVQINRRMLKLKEEMAAIPGKSSNNRGNAVIREDYRLYIEKLNKMKKSGRAPQSVMFFPQNGALAGGETHTYKLNGGATGPLSTPHDPFTRSVYLIGAVTYNDVFPGTKRHMTSICLVRNVGTDSFSSCPDSQTMN